MIPDCDKTGNLPPGIHDATLAEVEARYRFNSHRGDLLVGLGRLAWNLKAAGCSTLYLDGSFVSEKEFPNDFDGCWDAVGVDLNMVDPVLLDFDNGRIRQKIKYGGEVFPASCVASRVTQECFLDFFQKDKNTGLPKGIIKINL